MGSALSDPFLCSWQEEPPEPWLLHTLLHLTGRRGRAVDMQGLLAAIEGCCLGPGCVRQAAGHGRMREKEACTDT